MNVYISPYLVRDGSENVANFLSESVLLHEAITKYESTIKTFQTLRFKGFDKFEVKEAYFRKYEILNVFKIFLFSFQNILNRIRKFETDFYV